MPEPLAQPGRLAGGVVVEVTRTDDFPKAFAAIRSARPDGLMVLVEPMIGANSTQIIDFAASSRLPAMYLPTSPCSGQPSSSCSST